MGRMFFTAAIIEVLLYSISFGYSGGAGTAADPYQIADANDLLELAADTDNYDKCFILTADIDLAGYDGREGRPTFPIIAADPNYSEYDFQGTAFTGVFDGGNFTIRNLTIDLSAQTVEYVGLFGYLGFDARIKNLNLSGGYIVVGAGSANVGLLAGENYKGIISGCTVRGEIFAGDQSYNIGGLTGTNWWLIYLCNSYCTVGAGLESSNIGGMAGSSYMGFYDLTSQRGSSIIRCYSFSAVQGNSCVGGMVGWLSGYIVQSSSDSVVQGTEKVGSLIGGGCAFFMMNCFAAGHVSGGSDCGGLIGACGWGVDPTIIRNSYSRSTVSVEEGGVAGGLIGSGIEWITSCYYLAGVGPDNGIGIPLTDVQMQDPNNFQGWDFADSFADGCSDFWEMPSTGGYPALGFGRIGFYDWATNPGQGSQEAPYVISTAIQLLSIGWNLDLMDKHFVLACDIDLQSYPLKEILIGPFWLEFCGSFDGNGHKIENLFIASSTPFSFGGVFDTIYNGHIKKLGVENLNLSVGEAWWYIGGLAAMSVSSEIEQCFVTGQIQCGDVISSFGGLVGLVCDGVVHDCYTDVSFQSIDGSITIPSDYFAGVLFNGQIRNCYAKNTSVFCSDNYDGQILNCFWSVNYGFVYQDFIDAGWDFVGETQNGTENIWRYQEDFNDYPRLAWERLISVPDLTGLTQAEVAAILESQGLTSGTINYWYDQTIPKDAVLSQSPQPGNIVVEGRPINLVLSQGSCIYSGGGNGSQSNPCRIGTRDDLLLLGATIRDYDKHFVLVEDIDLSPNLPGGKVFTNAVIVSVENPGGWRSRGFRGSIDGQGHKIKNLTIHADSVYGAVGFIGTMEEGIISNICLVGITIESEILSDVGGLVGEMYGGIIENCSVEGRILSQPPYLGSYMGNLCGGLIGFTDTGSRIDNCYCDVDIQGKQWDRIGGLIGANDGTVNNCYATGWISGGDYVGGLILGNGYYGRVNNSFWDIETSGQTTSDSGTGLTTIQMQDINFFLSAGWDFVGETTNGTKDIWQMPADQYPHFVWEGLPDTEVPGIVGIIQSEAEAAIIAASLAVGRITVEYNDTVPAGIVISQSPAAGRSVYTGTGVKLTVSAGIAYYNNGSGTQNDPYRVFSATDLNTIGLRPGDWDKYFILVNDIDMSGISGSWYNIIGNGNHPFTGTFDGAGHVIRNFTSIMGGLFGQIANARIENLGLENANVDKFFAGGLVDLQDGGIISNCYYSGVVSDADFSGGLVGYLQNNGLITNCHTSGVVEGSGNEVGGLVGRLYSGTISNCYSTANVTGKQIIGGLVGRQDGGVISRSCSSGNVSGDYEIGGLVGEMSMYDEDDEKTISECYAAGDVNGKGEVGGLVGAAVIGVAIQNCYSTGHVTTENQWKGGLVGFREFVDVVNSFWDTETSGQTTSAGGIGKTTTDMKTLSTFTGWDFTTVWSICAGTNYPRLQWQIPSGDWVCPDGVYNEDLDYFVPRWLMDNCTSSNNYCGGVDMDSSGTVNVADFALFAQHWLEGM